VGVAILIFSGAASLLGFALGYGVAYISRLFNFFLLDAAIIGVLGGAVLLLAGLASRVRPGKVLILACVLFTFASWVGQRMGEYRFALRAHARAAILVVEESGESLDFERRKAVVQESKRLFEQNLMEESGKTGVWAYMEQQWSRGVLLLRLGSWSQRIPLPLTAVLMGQVLSSLVAFLLAWMLVRRLEWLPRFQSDGGAGPPSSADQDASDSGGEAGLC